MKKSILIFNFLFYYFFLFSQHHDDVLVVINESSSASIEIGEYFQQERNIPNENIIRIKTIEQEECTSPELENIINQIQNQFDENNLDGSINYVVLTKGIPHKIFLEEFDHNKSIVVDSRIAAFNSSFNCLGDSIYIYEQENSFYGTDNNFSFEEYGYFLTTRLDGFTVSDIKQMIDKSFVDYNIPDPSNHTIILDLVNLDSNILNFFQNSMNELYDYLSLEGWNVIKDYDNSPFSEQQDNVIGYITAGLGPYDHYDSNLEWSPNSLSFSGVCNDAYTFTESIANDMGSEGKYQLAHYIKEGAASSRGNPRITYVSEHKSLETLMAYFNTDQSFNLAESFYKGRSSFFKNQIYIGDPKMSLNIGMISSDHSLESELNDIAIFPNPISKQQNVKLANIPSSIDELNITILDVTGKIISQKQVNQASRNTTILETSNLNTGIYFLELSFENEKVNRKLVVH